MRFLSILLVFLLTASCAVDDSPYVLTEQDQHMLKAAETNGKLASEGFARCQKFVDGWLNYSDESSLLIPRNIEQSSDFWNAKDAAADNYPFMVLTTFFVDQDMFEGRMKEMLASEKKLTSRVNSLPDTYSFSKGGFLNDEVNMGEIVFGTSEYIKDGLLPLTEWLGQSPWSDRMIEMLYDLKKEMTIASDIDAEGFGQAPKEEVNGELLQVLSRVYWMTGDERFLNWAIEIGDHYLLGEHHPTRDLDYLRLRDHGCELISGLCELYVTTHYAQPEKNESYRAPLYEMLDRILEVGRNEDGFFYDGINPKTGEVVHSRIADNWGYTLNGFYSVYLIDHQERYRDPVMFLFSNLNKYRNHNWEGNADGYADAIESALNLYNRIEVEEVADWIDSEIQVMWNMQREDGVIEGWHGDGNFARTTIMYNLWKSKGLYVKPWREDLKLGAEQKGDSLLVTIGSDKPWSGQLYFDKERHSENLNLPMDWPRINQFPQWFTVDKTATYVMIDLEEMSKGEVAGNQLMQPMSIEVHEKKRLIVYPLRK